MKGFRARFDYILKHNTFFNKVFKFAASSFFRFVGIFVHVNKKAILFSAHSRKYNDSPRAIYENLLKDERYKNFDFYWAIDDGYSNEIPGECHIIKSDTMKYFVTALKCKYWVTCVNIERGLHFKKKKCIYLNTWHGIPIKTVGNEAAGRRDYNFSYINYFCISSEYEKTIYERSFNICDTQFLRCGMPRNDELYNASLSQKEKIKEDLGLPFDKKIILYAPTWRDSNNGGKSYDIKPPIDLKKWKETLGDKYILLFRTHPYTNKLMGINFDGFVHDFSNYPKINDLMIVSDFLISDYSATIFDYSILERPIICFAYDLEQYGNERGFAMDIENEMPLGIMRTEDDVIDQILNGNYEKECEKVKAFKNKYIAYGSNATKRCIEALLGENI